MRISHRSVLFDAVISIFHNYFVVLVLVQLPRKIIPCLFFEVFISSCKCFSCPTLFPFPVTFLIYYSFSSNIPFLLLWFYCSTSILLSFFSFVFGNTWLQLSLTHAESSKALSSLYFLSDPVVKDDFKVFDSVRCYPPEATFYHIVVPRSSRINLLHLKSCCMTWCQLFHISVETVRSI